MAKVKIWPSAAPETFAAEVPVRRDPIRAVFGAHGAAVGDVRPHVEVPGRVALSSLFAFPAWRYWFVEVDPLQPALTWEVVILTGAGPTVVEVDLTIGSVSSGNVSATQSPSGRWTATGTLTPDPGVVLASVDVTVTGSGQVAFGYARTYRDTIAAASLPDPSG